MRKTNISIKKLIPKGRVKILLNNNNSIQRDQQSNDIMRTSNIEVPFRSIMNNNVEGFILKRKCS